MPNNSNHIPTVKCKLYYTRFIYHIVTQHIYASHKLPFIIIRLCFVIHIYYLNYKHLSIYRVWLYNYVLKSNTKKKHITKHTIILIKYKTNHNVYLYLLTFCFTNTFCLDNFNILPHIILSSNAWYSVDFRTIKQKQSHYRIARVDN